MSSLFEMTDCPCNSLALNCLQMSCCMPSPAPDGTLDLFEAASTGGGGVVLSNNSDEGVGSGVTSFVGGSSSSSSLAACWMEHLAKRAPDTRYRDLIIVGTHNAASSTIAPSRPFSGMARCQNLSILQQLETAGIRFLDLRVGGGGGSSRRGHADVFVRHGTVTEGAPFLPILNQIDAFVTDHPKEVVILSLVPEYGVAFSSDQKLFVLKRLHEMFASRLVQASDMKDLLARWTLTDLHQRGKQVICLLHPRYCQGFKMPAVSGGHHHHHHNNGHGSNHHHHNNNNNNTREWTAEELETEFDVIDADVWMRSLWFNTRDASDLLPYVLRDIRAHGSRKRHALHCAQLVLTPGVGSVSDVVQAVVGTNPLRPISLSQHLYKQQLLNEYLRRHVQEPWNLFLLDFVDACPWTVRFLTALNFHHVPVKICLAAYHYYETSNKSSKKTKKDSQAVATGTVVDVTEKLERYICRDCACFSTNLLKDFFGTDTEEQRRSKEGGSLVVAYRLGAEDNEKSPVSYSVLSIPVVTPATLLLISYFATSADSVVSIPWNEQGIVHGGQILSSSSSKKQQLRGIVLRFKSTSNNKCVFDVVE